MGLNLSYARLISYFWGSFWAASLEIKDFKYKNTDWSYTKLLSNNVKCFMVACSGWVKLRNVTELHSGSIILFCTHCAPRRYCKININDLFLFVKVLMFYRNHNLDNKQPSFRCKNVCTSKKKKKKNIKHIYKPVKVYRSFRLPYSHLNMVQKDHCNVWNNSTLTLLTRVVASLSLPGGQDRNISSIFPHFHVVSLIFPQFIFIFFLILVFRVGKSPTRKGPGYATVVNLKLFLYSFVQWWDMCKTSVNKIFVVLMFWFIKKYKLSKVTKKIF